MLEVFGDKNSEEWRVAKQLAGLLQMQWPDIVDSKDDDIKICANAKIYGGNTQDIDIILMGEFKKGRFITPSRKLRDQTNKLVILRQLFIQNILLTIEIKSHDGSGVIFEGLTAKVKYHDEWHNATNQNENQKYSLKKYLNNIGVHSPWITGLIIFTSLDESLLPQRPHNILPGEFSLKQFFTAIAETNENNWKKFGDRKGTLSASTPENFKPIQNLQIFQKCLPTSLDRRKMDLITTRAGLDGNLLKLLGKEAIILRGRGGTGKTVILLQLAYKTYRDRYSRTLFLTYNLALLADVRRVMGLLGIPSNYGAGGIRVESSISFFGRVLKRADLIPDDVDFMDSYEDSLRSLNEMLNAGDVSLDEIKALLKNDKELFEYDYVMIDEAQDWPELEMNSLARLYPSASFVIADGQDQLIRDSYVDWKDAFTLNGCHIESFNRSLRMKSNLARFVNEFSNQLGVPSWKVKPNEEAKGGRVIVLEKKYMESESLHKETLSEKALGENKPIDTLFCVPPGQVIETENGERRSLISLWLQEQGHLVWDGASSEIRKDVPRSEDQYRVVQYQSCRGLEGWIVVCLDLDQHYDNKYREEFKNNNTPIEQELHHRSEANIFAAFWTLMPICRAMDTLVITISNLDGQVAKALKECQKNFPDFIEWQK